MNKTQSRLRRARKSRIRMRGLGMPRLSVHRTSAHIYAQIISADANVVASASTNEKAVAEQVSGHKGNISAAGIVGKAIAERAKAAGIDKVAFDRSGFKYHGRVKALADAARENGLEF
ncbi:MAG: 50S ribosomal protein L18 [Chromatiales bacterium]|jgi:large subunit ribosomal protein L18